MKVAKQRPREIQPKDRAAGVVMMHAGRVLLLRRAGEGIWGLPGGGLEEGENPIQAAIRECREEVGFAPSGELKEIHRTNKHGADYTTFFASHADASEAVLNDEHTAAAWVPIDRLHKYNMHPGVSEVLGATFRADAEDFASHFGRDPETETEVAKAIHEGELHSPQRFSNVTFFDIRITGTGVSMRIGKTDPETGEKQENEFVLRKPDIYLNDEFLARCNGLPVIIEHPDSQALDSKEFSSRIVGTIVLPYIKGNEVWGIARIYDAAAAEIMAKHQLSTSPSVVFFNPKVNEQVELDEGAHLLIEGNPSLVDHIAIVPDGVWDKGSGPTGVKTIRADAQERSGNMEHGAEAAAKKDAEGDPMSKMMEMLTGLVKDIGEVKAKIAQLEAIEEEEAGELAAAKPDTSMPSPELPAAGAAPAAPVADNAIPAEHIKKLADRMDAFEAAQKPRAPEEESHMADAQAKADSAYTAHGKRAPAPMMGESLLAYRRRLAAGMQAHSDKAKSINLGAINDSAAFGMVEEQIYNDALHASKKAGQPGPGMLIPKVWSDEAGRRITEFEGDPAACWGPFMAPTQMVKRFVTQH